ncbi:hypothetical protein BDSB_19960 [Burkholderia dolosa PC543]|nr:hypothetical protein BDSB_19960 [Burkholderia dolosa PC543]
MSLRAQEASVIAGVRTNGHDRRVTPISATAMRAMNTKRLRRVAPRSSFLS